jgi:hypothetical protein
MAIIEMVITHFAYSITSLIFIVVLTLAFMYMSRFIRLEEAWLGIIRTPINTRFLSAVLFGMIVGLVASFCIILIGIPLDYKAVLYIWPLAILLMLFNRRYLCLSYAGGIVSLSALLFGWPKVNVPSIIALVGILHLMESLLIWLDGYKDSLPIWVKHKNDDTVGAYLMNKIWPIPLVVLIVPEGILQAAEGAVAMPDWWPLFQQQPGVEVLALFPIVAVMGYSDIAITQSSRGRVKETGFWLGVYSIVILILALISSRMYWVSFIAAFAAPVLHELLIIFGRKAQFEGDPAFKAPWRGLKILDVLPMSQAEKMGVKPGDLLLAMNGRDVNSKDMLDEILMGYPSYAWLDIKREDKDVILEYKDYQNGIHDLGVIFVPRHTTKHFRIDEQNSIIQDLWGKIRKKLK